MRRKRPNPNGSVQIRTALRLYPRKFDGQNDDSVMKARHKLMNFAARGLASPVMKLTYSLLLLLVMSVNVALPAIETICNGWAWQIECDADDADEEQKKEREGEEKEIYLWKYGCALENRDFRKHHERAIFPDCVGVLSEAYAFPPEMPPDAAPVA